ncbi:MAG TPA: hypothetical protein PK335_04095 [Draconibacterium sp.]|nr:hypothetical protein [Draconibacterium sp.]
MQKARNRKFDRMEIGLLTGLLLPVIIFFLVYLIGEDSVSFPNYLKSMWKLQALVKIMSLCVFANLALFWGFLKLKYERAARGVLGATILYAFLVLISRAF